MLITGFLFGLGLIAAGWVVNLLFLSGVVVITKLQSLPKLPPIYGPGKGWEVAYREQWERERKLGKRIV